MLPFKKILCPTDFSKPSYQALEAGTEFALHFDADLYVLHVVSPVPAAYAPEPLPAFDVVGYEKGLMASSKKKLDEIVKGTMPKGLSVRTMVVVGTAAEQIVGVAEHEKTDFIVIATGGETGWRRFVFGSVAEKVVRLAPCPVLTLQAPEEERE